MSLSRMGFCNVQKLFVSVLVVAISSVCSASVSTNVPLDHWGYDAMDKLIGQGLVLSDLMATKPVSRMEMARLIDEVESNIAKQPKTNPIIQGIVVRLREEFAHELIRLNSLTGTPSAGFVKPLEDPYFRYVRTQQMPDLENEQGDLFGRGSNQRFGFSSRSTLSDRFAFYLHPEYESPSIEDASVNLVEAYGKARLGNVEIQAGKDSLWWGPGYHGSLIMSNNAEPLTMLKVANAQPILLPWLFRRLGPLRGTLFVSELEKGRNKSEARLSGLRLNFKPLPDLEMGLSRTMMFGGKEHASTHMSDYLRILWPGNKKKENHMAGFDLSYRARLPRAVPAESVKLYGEYTEEDSKQWRPLLGAQINDILKTGRTDLRIEYAKTFVGGSPGAFYSHPVFGSGYTYDGRIMGHHIGSDARDLFLRLTHYLTPNLVLGLEYDKQTYIYQSTGVRSRSEVDQYGVDIRWFTKRNWEIRAAYRHEEYKDHAFLSGDNQIIDIGLVYDF
jgi:hypothetical protein